MIKNNFLKLIMTFVILSFLTNGIIAQNFVNESFANEIGKNFISNKMGKADVSLNLFHTENGADGQPNLYIFNVEGGGFVIVSASKNVKPVLAYSLEHRYMGDIPETAWYFINSYSKNVDYCDERGILMNADVEAEWSLLENNELPATKNTRTVVPLIQTLWNQDYPYNYYAPETSGGWWGGGPGGHCYAGCVACAMSQIMKYWNHPVHGHGSHSYTHGTYGVQSANFGETTYDWDIMPTALGYEVDDAAKAVALLMYHCGVSVNMNFGPDGSGAYSPDVETALRQYFGYCAASYQERSKYTEEEWIAMLKSELDKSQPVYFSGTSDSGGGHAIVCDGYDSNDYFHFNLGWSGSGNDYYSINDVAGYNNNEAIVMNIVPLEINADENAIIYVTPDGTGDGSSWENATHYLEYTSARASDVSTMVWVKTGTYYGEENNKNGAFSIYKNNRVYGGFAGNETPDFNLNNRDFEANPTILDGQGINRVLYQTDHFTNGEYSIWDGFTIQNGNTGAGGGAYLCSNSRFSNCKFLNNHAIGFGGGAYVISAYYSNSTTQFTNCTFEGNTGAIGGAICDMTGAYLLNCRFTNNSSTTKGGAYYIFANKEGKMVNTIFDHNHAKQGGAFYNTGKMTVVNCDFVDNQATEDGGGLYNESAYSRFYNTIFWGNTANGEANQIEGRSKFFYCGIQGGYEGTNIINLAANNDGMDSDNYPRFENPDEGNYALNRLSVCVDAGDKYVGGVTGPDILGNQRVVNNQIDLGAIEYQYGLSVDDVVDAAIMMYPNPIDNQLSIIIDGSMTVDVYNCLGQKILSVEARNELTLNTSEWERGIYLIKVNERTFKVLK
ncbi:MAG: thiol protease/hemagglutinin PrtT [Paludibacteraceae bacterium]|nr:thiol protease/hemagglutinin PrtT [Paludibacteraceae bacterium]